MSLRVDTYENLITQVESLTGSDLMGKELDRVNANINLAARRAYRESVWWERYLVVSEPRTIARGVIDFTEDSYYVYGAGEEDSNSLYIRNGTANSLPKYTKYDTDGTTALYNVEALDSNGDDWILETEAGSVIYAASITSLTPPPEGWEQDVSPFKSPRLQPLSEIDTCLLITSQNILEGGAYCPLDYYSSSRGITLTNRNAVDRIVYVTYKKAFTDVYGCGTGGTTSSVPLEFFNYMALYAARMHQVSQRQANSSPLAVIASREVEEAMQDELMKIEEQNISNTIAKRVQTYQTYNSQL